MQIAGGMQKPVLQKAGMTGQNALEYLIPHSCQSLMKPTWQHNQHRRCGNGQHRPWSSDGGMETSWQVPDYCLLVATG